MSKAEKRACQYTGYCKNQSYSDFLNGYHQAEKDLSISWIKEVSGVKELSRAKEEALKAYPPQSIAANYDTINRRDAFEYGYLKAEKDLELTWEDINNIKLVMEQVECDYVEKDKKLYTKDFYEEVLKRLKERKQQLTQKLFLSTRRKCKLLATSMPLQAQYVTTSSERCTFALKTCLTLYR